MSDYQPSKHVNWTHLMTKSESETKGAQPEPAELVHRVELAKKDALIAMLRNEITNLDAKVERLEAGAEPVSAPTPVAWEHDCGHSNKLSYSDEPIDGHQSYEIRALVYATHPADKPAREPVSARPASEPTADLVPSEVAVTLGQAEQDPDGIVMVKGWFLAKICRAALQSRPSFPVQAEAPAEPKADS